MFKPLSFSKDFNPLVENKHFKSIKVNFKPPMSLLPELLCNQIVYIYCKQS